MPNLFDKYRFTANDGTGDQAVYPLARGLKKAWSLEENSFFYRLKMPEKLLFKGSEWTYWKDLYEAGDCADISLLIEKYCGGEWVEWFAGKVPLQNIQPNYSKCEATVEVVPNDTYECFFNQLTKKNNWFELASGAQYLSVKAIYGTVETKVCTENSGTFFALDPKKPNFYKGCWGTGYTTSDEPDASLAWRPIANYQRCFYIGPGPTYTYLLGNVSTTWARETITQAGTPPGDGWINLGANKWVRPIVVAKAVSDYIQVRDTVTLDELTWGADTVTPKDISHGYLLSEMLPAIVSAIGCNIDTVVSNFFNINPDATAPTNDAYTFAAANLDNVFIFQKSDVVRSDVSNDATRFDLALQDFFGDLANWGQVLWGIEDVGGTVTLRLEHYTYFEGNNGTDLTTLEGGKYINGLHSFTSNVKIPAWEGLAYQEAYREKFLAKRIEYPDNCVTGPGDEKTIYQLCTDFGGLNGNPDAGLDGFFLMATHDIGGGEYLMNTLGGEGNGCMSWDNIIAALWPFGRFRLDATATVPGFTVQTIKKTRQQAAIKIPMCCDDINPAELINTQMGWGQVQEATEDTTTGTLTLTLLQ